MPTPPQFTGTADQRYFLEPLDGGVDMAHYMRRFPDTLYNKAPDSHLMRFMYTLLGPAGVGWLKKQIVEARLLLEAHGGSLEMLDNMYGIPLSFPRLPAESYTKDVSGLLLNVDWQTIRAQDEAYRSRVLEFLRGVRLGASIAGLSRIASAGTGQPIDVAENYRYLFDNHSDDPLGLPYQGLTLNLEEFIMLPRPTVSQSMQQEIRFDLLAPHTNFTISFNGYSATLGPGANAAAIQSALQALPTIGSANVVVSGGPSPLPIVVVFTGSLSNQVLPTLEVVFNQATFRATATSGLTVLTGTIPLSGTLSAGQSVVLPASLFSTVVEEIVGQSVVLSAPYEGATGQVQFTVASFVPITVTTGALDPSTETVSLSDAQRHDAQVAVDLIKPVPTIPTWGPATSTLREQPYQTILASTEYVEVIRFVTGAPKVSWSPTDTLHWIEASIENQAPQLNKGERQHYVNFHNVASVQAYTDAALSDANYGSDSAVVASYPSTHVGPFPEMETVLPFFRQFTTDYSTVFGASQALANFPDQLQVTDQTDAGIAIINRTYPADYLGLQGAPSLSEQDPDFWSSAERASGADILEIDLGSPQAVNFISLEVTHKPQSIAIAYDLLDQSPARTFAPVVLTPGYPNASSVYFNPSQQTPWVPLTFLFDDGQNMIFTRYIRLTFTRLAGSGYYGRFLFNYTTQTQVPWTLDVRNLRIGRNVAPSVV